MVTEVRFSNEEKEAADSFVSFQYVLNGALAKSSSANYEYHPLMRLNLSPGAKVMQFYEGQISAAVALSADGTNEGSSSEQSEGDQDNAEMKALELYAGGQYLSMKTEDSATLALARARSAAKPSSPISIENALEEGAIDVFWYVDGTLVGVSRNVQPQKKARFKDSNTFVYLALESDKEDLAITKDLSTGVKFVRDASEMEVYQVTTEGKPDFRRKAV